uniref:Leucine-rich repeat-containing N-terminal plant-type domain-containing protein n=1 Tax=Chenopodium quinoa TaxID=63459 RepID=A0A803KT56_CHEQI
MKTIPLISSSWSFLLILIVWLRTCSCIPFVSSQCLHDQKSLLLELKNNLAFAPNAYDKLEGWNQSTDCCHWSGVTCNNSSGRVIGLDLSSKDIIGGIDDSSSLFHLQFLQSLNLASNNYLQGEIPSRIGTTLSSLTYLNLSWVGFSGQVPIVISNLVKLVVLDISNSRVENAPLYMQKPNLATIIRNLTNIKELYLDYVINSAIGDKWCKALSSSLPRLQILSMSGCTIPEWMWKITRFNLSFNHLVELEPPLTFSNNLGFIDLSSNNLQGKFPFVKSNYYYLDCSNNNFTSFNPDIGNYLSYASYMSFSRNNLHGIIPASLCSAKNLELLNLEHNHLGGTIPECFTTMTQLIVLNLRGNQLDGEIPDRFIKGCSLQTLDLNDNFMQGRIPRSLAYCKDLKVLDFGNNQLDDTFPCHLNSLFNLQVLVLHSNKLHGTIVCPQSHSIWPLLQIMDVASNHFVGELKSQILFKWRLMVAGTTKEKSKFRFLQSSSSTGDDYQNSVSVNFELQYILTIFTSIDFSNNAFHSELPEEL